MLSQKTPLQQCRLRDQFEGNQCSQDSVVCSQFRRARALSRTYWPKCQATAQRVRSTVELASSLRVDFSSIQACKRVLPRLSGQKYFGTQTAAVMMPSSVRCACLNPETLR